MRTLNYEYVTQCILNNMSIRDDVPRPDYHAAALRDHAVSRLGGDHNNGGSCCLVHSRCRGIARF